MGLFGNSLMGRGGIYGEPDKWLPESMRIPDWMRQQTDLGVPAETRQAVNQAAAMPAQEQKPRGFWNGGDKFTTRDGFAAVLAAIGDIAARRNGYQGGAVQNLAGGRADFMNAQRMAEAAQAKRQAELQDYERKKQIDQRYPSERAPYRWESNDGSLMELGPDGQPTVRYKDPTPRMNFIPDGMGGGRFVPMPGTGGGPAPGTVEDGYRFKGGDPADQSNWEQVGGPAATPGNFRRW